MSKRFKNYLVGLYRRSTILHKAAVTAIQGFQNDITGNGKKHQPKGQNTQRTVGSASSFYLKTPKNVSRGLLWRDEAPNLYSYFVHFIHEDKSVLIGIQINRYSNKN